MEEHIYRLCFNLHLNSFNFLTMFHFEEHLIMRRNSDFQKKN